MKQVSNPKPYPEADTILVCFLSIARAIAGQTDYQRVLEIFANKLHRLIPHDHLDIVLLSEGDEIVCYEVGVSTEWSRPQAAARAAETSPIAKLLRGEVPYVLTDDAWSDPRFHFEGADDGPIFAAQLRSRIVVPLRIHGEMIGSLAISSQQVGTYSYDDLSVAKGAADLVSAYVYSLVQGEEARKSAVAESEARGREELLRTGALRLTQGMEQERRRIGMDIHDQTVADLARLSRRLSKLNQGETLDQAELNSIESDLSIYLGELRRIVEDMNPGVLQLFGFAPAIEAHLRRCKDATGLKFAGEVEDRSDGEIDKLPETIRTSLYRIVQEAINNAVRHSQAKTVTTRIESQNDRLTIEVIDDGIGLNAEDLPRNRGIGHMTTRAALVGATISIKNAKNENGTCVSIVVSRELPTSDLTDPQLLVKDAQIIEGS